MAVTINDKETERVYSLTIKQGNAFEIHQIAGAEEYMSQSFCSSREDEQTMISINI